PIVVALERSPLFPDVPAVAEFARDERTRQILALFVAPQSMDRPILAPPGVPAERVATLRVAFHAAMHDPGFVAEAPKPHLPNQPLEIADARGERVAKSGADAYALSPEIVKAATEAMSVAAGRQGE